MYNSYTRTAAYELAVRKIRVNAVNPGPVQTEIFGKTGMQPEDMHHFATDMQKRVALRQFGIPESIVKLVTFLASDEASFITGAEYNIDGGVALNPILG